MPRDKTDTHIRVMEAARNEFLEKGFEKTSIRDIGANAGITSAGLYRHCTDKEDLFYQVVQPAIDALEEWIGNHIRKSYRSLEENDYNGINSQSEIDMVREVAIPYRTEFKLLLTKSAGTKYENFIHTMVEEHEQKMWEGLKSIESHGFPVKKVSHEELHILLSAYITALLEPIVHDYDEERIDHYLDTVEAFFMPGWHQLLGI
ncbi:MAG: TetR/AcrR family transcriptional regulator [Lachnospiraceae bacterium]|nr:TetR/AcrR family transcriptional regulator [Lachnospiraceae bacterium]